MPAALRLGRRRWFEEDCEAALVGLAFADDLEFTDSRRDDLAAVVANWFPTNWEAYFGRTLEPGESYLRDKETFEAATADQFVVDSALGDWHENVPAGLVGVTALRRSDGITTPLLPDFVLEADIAHVRLPQTTPKPRPQPRRYRPASYWRDCVNKLSTEMQTLAEPIITDRAAAGGAGLGPKRTRRVQQQMDTRLARYTQLQRRRAYAQLSRAGSVGGSHHTEG